jgi:hypothetical protein
MVAADHDRRANLARTDELVDREPGLRARSEAEPTDTGRQPLKCDPLRSEIEPALENLVLVKEVTQRPVDRRDVLRLPRQRRPAKRPDAAAKERSDIGGNEARVGERFRDACLERLPPQVVAVVEDVGAGSDVLEESLDVAGDRVSRAAQVLVRIARAQGPGFVDGEAGGDVAVQGVVGGGLVGHEIEPLSSTRELRDDVGGVAEEPDGERSTL